MASLNITVDSAQVRHMLAIAPERVKSRLNRVLNIVAIEAQREMRQQANVGVTGDLRKSVKYEVVGLQAIIGPTASYADAVESGSRPHYVSIRPGSSLRTWADRKGINPYALQKSIARKGTRPHPFVEPTRAAIEPLVERRFDSEMDKLAQELSNG